MSIDYDRQFKALTLAEVIREGENWKRERHYLDAKNAFESARRSESRGVAVALAKTERESGGWAYFVWTGER